MNTLSFHIFIQHLFYPYRYLFIISLIYYVYHIFFFFLSLYTLMGGALNIFIKQMSILCWPCDQVTIIWSKSIRETILVLLFSPYRFPRAP